MDVLSLLASIQRFEASFLHIASFCFFRPLQSFVRVCLISGFPTSTLL